MSEKRRAIVVWGGWDGHEPELVARRVEKMLLKENFDVEFHDNLDAFLDKEHLKTLDLIFPLWTM